ncbi:uncharacterized protein G2W53_026177 [Senna tora]|uniref:Uncharacterized protein n=1 Tax=Senna tora TaxID=362788 RepID=A0A834TEK4_9FABA|nr:uncharacterized protein G2W53_026177 [Senna tora]
MIGDAIDTSNTPRDTILHEGDLSSQDLMQDMVYDAFGVSRHVGVEADGFIVEVDRHSNDLEKEIKCATQRSEDRDKWFMGPPSYISKNLPGGVPSEFVDLINSQTGI